MKTYVIEEEKNKIIERYIIPFRGVSCKEVLKMCLPVMQDLCPPADVSCSLEKETDAWMERLYCFFVSAYFLDYDCRIRQEETEAAREFYLDILEELLERERQQIHFDICRDFLYISREERAQSEIQEEYACFWKCFQDLRVYPFLRIAREGTPYDALGHIAGVHNVAMHIARQLVHTSVSIDLALISAAAMIHDIGKFGCRPSEARRIPYLHYYYTAQFSKRFGFEMIGHIAANHSTWDLELENLSVENLILIYADFRVKSIRGENGEEIVRFWTLDESYEVILGKLDNVDEKKRDRYRKVFQKLKDFENFLISLGVSPDLDGGWIEPLKGKSMSILTMPEVAERMKYNAIQSNLVVMYHMFQESRFVSLLEEAKGERDWRNVRSYLNVLDEYSTYMTCAQKDIVLKFLYEMMMHRDGDIRRQSAQITGRIISDYEVRYQKEIPEGAKALEEGTSSIEKWEALLHMVLIPDHKISQQHKRWLGYALKTVFSTVMRQMDSEKQPQVLEKFLEYYGKTTWEKLTMFVLMDCAGDFSCCMFCKEQKKILFRFAKAVLEWTDSELRTAALRFLKLWLEQGWTPEREDWRMLEKYIIPSKDWPVCCCYLADRIREKSNGERKDVFVVEKSMVSLLFLENQQIDTPWIFKRVNLEILKEYCKKDEKETFQLAAHLANMLQNTDRIVIKHHSGNELTELVFQLSDIEKYEIAMELARGLEIGEYSTSKYIPEYLGKVFFCLSVDAQRELLEMFRKMIDSTNPKTAIVTLETIGIMIQILGEITGTDAFCEPEGGLERGSGAWTCAENQFTCWRRDVLEGLLLRGAAHYLDEVSQEAFYIIGHSIFGSSRLNMEQKYGYFQSAGRKLLTLMSKEKSSLQIYNHAAALNHIYRFLSDYLFCHEEMPEETAEKIAFFPGTFDPFSLGHKEIVREIQSRGFRVYLALDEFSWSKKTQPYKIRKKILMMSAANLKDVYLFPEEVPVNISNPLDLKRLKECFPGKEVHLVVGSDVVEHASAYKKKEQEDSVHHFPHIVFIRKRKDIRNLEGLKVQCREVIHENVEFLTLAKKFEGVSSTRIREHIDRNRDISNLVDANVQNYIYDLGLYSREPMFKFMTASTPIDAYFIEHMEADIKKELVMGLLKEPWNYARSPLDARLDREETVLIRNERQYRQIIGAVLFHQLSFSGLYEECGSLETTAYFREHVPGKTAVITGIYGREAEDLEDSRQSVLTEMLMECAAKEYMYVICFGDMGSPELLLRQGFIRLSLKQECYLVDLRNPIVLFCDTSMSLKEPFRSCRTMTEKIWEMRRRLQKAFAELYPGNLVLCIDFGILNHRLTQRITKENCVPMIQMPRQMLGEKMCVPFGRILRGMLVPNCVTKELDAEKINYPDMEQFEIGEYPNGAPLDIQIRTIKSFRRPIILVDDLYHKGYRMKVIDSVLEKERVEADKIIVGVLSGKGKDLADQQGKEVDCVYFLPNMRAWFMESCLYPFIGGDSIMKERERKMWTTILPSINSILPYQVPHFLSGISAEGFYHFSELCLENAEEILLLLEKEYQSLTGRKLTVHRLGEVMSEPRCPDLGMEILDTSSETPSAYLQYERKRLKRLKSLTWL